MSAAGPRRPTRRRTERGATAVEAALVIPAILLLAALTAASWRLWQARGDAQSAAETAARAASTAHGPTQAGEIGPRAAVADLAGSLCRSPSIRMDVSGLNAPVGWPGVVGARVTCTVSMSDLVLPGLPGSMTASAVAEAPIDSHRERQP